MSENQRVIAGSYTLGSLIGRGGMAEVHEGRDLRLGRRVAVKILRPDLAKDPTFQARFRREAQSAAALNHPNIVAVYDTGEDTLTSPNGERVTVPYIVMEFVDGMTLRQLLASERNRLGPYNDAGAADPAAVVTARRSAVSSLESWSVVRLPNWAEDSVANWAEPRALRLSVARWLSWSVVSDWIWPVVNLLN